MHTQVVGTTNAGKTESVILPWAIDDIKRKRGLIIIDGKSDKSMLNKLYSYAKVHNREDEFKILSLCDVSISNTFNPFSYGSALEVTERVFKSFNFENEYYKSLQYESLLHVLLIFAESQIVPTPLKIIESLRSPVLLVQLAKKTSDQKLINWSHEFLKKTNDERSQETSGLISQLQALSVGDTASIFNTERSDIDLEKALNEGAIIYCQLPVLKIPTLGKTVGKLILQCLQSAVASRHLGTSKNKEFFSIYLDDFTEYLTESFVSLLNKSRSANVGVVFAHQALGDLAGLGDGVKNTILSNSNLKVFMRTNEPESAEYFSQTIGTIESLKRTERETSGTFGAEKTGEASVRDVEAFKYHPNIFKQELGVGEAVIIIPHAKGSLPVRLQFRKTPDIVEDICFPKPLKAEPISLSSILKNQDAQELNRNNASKNEVSKILEAENNNQRKGA
jgi:type IV secretory pathway TraG/TraD family ATPase VirD4